MAAPVRSEGGKRYEAVATVLAAVLFVSPWLFNYAGDLTAAAASWAAGVLMAFNALFALVRHPRLFCEANVVLGILAAAAPWILGFQSAGDAVMAHLIVGLLVAILSAAELVLWRGPKPQVGV